MYDVVIVFIGFWVDVDDLVCMFDGVFIVFDDD